jgi:hypothetical protein
MADDFVLSASSLNTYLRCGRQWMYAYVQGVKAAPSLRAVRGIAVHAGVELNFRQKMQTKTDLPIADVQDAFGDAYDAETRDGYEAKEGETHGSVKDMGYKMAENIQPVIVEEPISFTINGQVWTGQIDYGTLEPTTLWGEPEESICVRDAKTSAQTPRPDSYLVNMTGYALSVRQATGKKEAGVKFDYVVGPKNGKPYYKEIDTGVVTDEQIKAFAWVVGDVSDKIKQGSFPANGLTNPGVCDWCGYRAMCPAYKMKNPNA